MIKIVTNAEMKAIEQEVVQSGQTVRQIRQIAAQNLGEIIEREFGYMAESGAIGLIGTNPKREIAVHALLHLAKENWSVTAYLLGEHGYSEADLRLLQEQGCAVILISKDDNLDQLRNSLKQHAVWIDAVAAADAPLPLDDSAVSSLKVIGEVHESSPAVHHIIAIDCPSGIQAESGILSAEAVSAEMTIAMGVVNPGILNIPVYEKLGELQTVELPFLSSSPTFQGIQSYILEYESVQEILSKAFETSRMDRQANHSLCVLGGSIPQPGGVLLATRAALRAGAEAVTVAIPSLLYEALAGHLPEANWLLLAHEMGAIAADMSALVQKNIQDYSCVYLGMGIGREASTKEFLTRIFEPRSNNSKRSIGFIHTASEGDSSLPSYPPFVIDLDAFAILEQIPEWHHMLPASILLLDKARLTGLLEKEGAAVSGDTIDLVRKTAKDWNQVIILQDNPTLVVSPEGRISTITGPACPARAGAGYLLGGLTAGLCARRVSLFDAASAGAWIFQAAVRMVQGHSHEASGIIASDIEAAIPDVLQAI